MSQNCDRGVDHARVAIEHSYTAFFNKQYVYPIDHRNKLMGITTGMPNSIPDITHGAKFFYQISILCLCIFVIYKNITGVKFISQIFQSFRPLSHGQLNLICP